MDVLLIGASQQGCLHLAGYLERLGCNCSFATTDEEIRTVLDQRQFPLVLSTCPVTQGSPLMELLRASGCAVFYSVPVEDSCLWFQALPEPVQGPRLSALHPGEFMSILRGLIGRQRDERAEISGADGASRASAGKQSLTD